MGGETGRRYREGTKARAVLKSGGFAPYGRESEALNKAEEAAAKAQKATPSGASYSPTLAGKRARLIAELNANPATKANLFRLAKAEWGNGGPAQIQAGIESILNRAALRGETVAQAIGTGYHSPSRGRGGVAGLPAPKDADRLRGGAQGGRRRK